MAKKEKWFVDNDPGFAPKHTVAKASSGAEAAKKRQELRAKEQLGSSNNYTVRKG